MKLRHKKLKIVLAMVILDYGYPSPQLHQTLKPMRELFCTGYPKRGRPSSSAPNLAKQSLLLVLPHHFTFLSPLNILVQQQFVFVHFSTFNFTFLILQHLTLSVNTPLRVKSLFFCYRLTLNFTNFLKP